MEKITILFICLITAAFQCQAQEIARSTVSSIGTSTTISTDSKSYVVQQSIGQASVIGKFDGDGIALRQGFIQPPIRVTAIVTQDTNLTGAIYPNPFSSHVNVAFNEEIKESISVVLYDILGRIVHQDSFQAAQEISINLEFLASAQYVLLVSSNNKQLKANLIKE